MVTRSGQKDADDEDDSDDVSTQIDEGGSSDDDSMPPLDEEGYDDDDSMPPLDDGSCDDESSMPPLDAEDLNDGVNITPPDYEDHYDDDSAPPLGEEDFNDEDGMQPCNDVRYGSNSNMATRSSQPLIWYQWWVAVDTSEPGLYLHHHSAMASIKGNKGRVLRVQNEDEALRLLQDQNPSFFFHDTHHPRYTGGTT